MRKWERVAGTWPVVLDPVRRTPQSLYSRCLRKTLPRPKATEFILVDAEQNASGPAFDHARLAASLSKAAKREYQLTELPFDTFDYAKDGRSISLQVDGVPWTCQLENYECKREPEPVAGQ